MTCPRAANYEGVDSATPGLSASSDSFAEPIGLVADDHPALIEHTSPEKEFKIRLASNLGQRNSASMLVRKMYSWRGYESSFALDVMPNCVTLIASSGDQTIATITVRFDGPHGLLGDILYSDVLTALRREGKKLCEFTKLAVENCVRSKQVLAALFHIAFIYASDIHGMTDLFIEVNPRHVKFYEKMLGFTQVGEEKTSPRVNAPAVLLRLELSYVKWQIAQFGGRSDLTDNVRSLYPFGFSAAEAEGVANRLRLVG